MKFPTIPPLDRQIGMHVSPRMLFFALALSNALAQTAVPTFEVASIKPNTDVTMKRSGLKRLRGGGVEITNMSVRGLIGFAYDSREYEVTGGARWLDNERWDIIAKPSPEAAAAEPPEFDDASTVRLRARIRSLLAERFQMQIHRETREMPAYALVMSKDGHKMTPAAAGAVTQMFGQVGGIDATAVSMKTFADEMLSRTLGRRVVDQTELTGRFDFQLKYTPETLSAPSDAGVSTTDLAAVAVIDAVREQLGLRVEPRKMPLEILVIDRAERPTAN